MSVEVSSWAWKQPIPTTRKVVLLALADHADNEGQTWVKIPALIRKTGCSQATVYRCITELKTDGYLSEKDGIWFLRVRKSFSQGEKDSQTESPLYREPSSNHQRTDVDLVFNHWIETMEKDPARTKLNGKRTSVIKARFKEGYSVEDLCQAISGARSDRFLMGKENGSPGYTDLTTILRDGAQVERLRDLAAKSIRKRKPKPYDREALIERQMTLTGESREEAAETVDERRRREVAMA